MGKLIEIDEYGESIVLAMTAGCFVGVFVLEGDGYELDSNQGTKLCG